MRTFIKKSKFRNFSKIANMSQSEETPTLEELVKRIEAIENEINPLKKDNLQLKKENEQLKKDNSHLKKENVKIKKEIEEIKRIIANFEQSARIISSSEDQSANDSSNSKASKRSPQSEKSKTYSNFNSLPLKTQQSVISDIIRSLPSDKNRSFKKLNNLLLYFLRFNKSLEALHYVAIPTKSIDELFENMKEGDQELKSIQILSNAIEILF